MFIKLKEIYYYDKHTDWHIADMFETKLYYIFITNYKKYFFSLTSTFPMIITKVKLSFYRTGNKVSFVFLRQTRKTFTELRWLIIFIVIFNVDVKK